MVRDRDRRASVSTRATGRLLNCSLGSCELGCWCPAAVRGREVDAELMSTARFILAYVSWTTWALGSRNRV
jgi:hypothetical protein